MRKILSLILILLVFAGCATCGATKFVRIKNSAQKFAMPMYQGTPPAEYKYEVLAKIEGVYEEKTVLLKRHTGVGLSAAYKDLIKKATILGANAIINVKYMGLSGKKCVVSGEAVIFEHMPED